MTWSTSSWSTVECFVLLPTVCPSSHVYYYAKGNVCTNHCDGSTNGYSCSYAIICPSNCQTCSTEIACTTCSSGYYLREDNFCYSSCIDGTFPNSTSRSCIPCSVGCFSCFSVSVCVTCLINYYKGVDNVCYLVCPAGFYGEEQNKTCLACPRECATCSSPTTCLSCEPGYTIQNFYEGYQGSKLCTSCLMGHEVPGGCTKTEGCLEVVYYSSTDLVGLCIRCATGFSLNPFTWSCDCPTGTTLAGDYCTSIAGCTATKLLSGTVECSYCDITRHFIIDPSSLRCNC